MKYSDRIQTIINMIRPCTLLADIGCDHGYVCIEAVRGGTALSALACDVKEGPLSIAAENIRAAGLSDRIRTVLSDGFEAIDAGLHPDCVVITGLGGLLMKRILSKAPALKQLVLGPQSDQDLVRHYVLDDMGYTIVREFTVFDEGKYYTLMDVAGPRRPEDASGGDTEVTCETPYAEYEYLYGRHIDAATEDTYRAYLQHQHQILQEALSNAMRGCAFGASESMRKLKDQIGLVEQAMERK